jgi:hypothetical protein
MYAEKMVILRQGDSGLPEIIEAGIHDESDKYHRRWKQYMKTAQSI